MSPECGVGPNIAPHNPALHEQSRFNYWVECECGWLGTSSFTAQNAMKSHQRHVQKETR